jgi:microcystin-dependent protein
MDEAFMGSIQAVAFNYAPRGWALCNGQIINIVTNTALFSLLGNKFGGDGKVTFGLPDLQGRTIIGSGAATPNTSAVEWAEKGGATSVALTINNFPVHNHQLVNGTGTNGTVKVSTTVYTTTQGDNSNVSDNGANGLGTGGTLQPIYRELTASSDYIGGLESKIAGSTSSEGGGATSVSIQNPFLGLNYCIATQGYYPSRN